MSLDNLLNDFAKHSTQPVPPSQTHARMQALDAAWQRLQSDPGEARRIRGIIAEIDDISAAYDLGERAESEGDLDIAEWAFRQAADADFGDAVYRLALVHARKAEELFATALASGIPDAAEHLHIQHPDAVAVRVRNDNILAMVAGLGPGPTSGSSGSGDAAPGDPTTPTQPGVRQPIHLHAYSLDSMAEMEEAADVPCRTQDPEAFFAESPEDVEWAKRLCRGCPVREACLRGALERREPWGVWGGELFVQGIVVPRKNPRARPRKQLPPGTESAAG